MKKEPKSYMITEEVFSQIRETVGSHISETGGILGSSNGKHIDHFYFDKTAEVTGATYEPDCNELNPVIQKWYEEGIEFVGFIHSHPRGAIKPSNPDNLYTKKIMEAFEMEYFVSLIVQVHRSLKGKKAKLFAYGYYLADPVSYTHLRIAVINPKYNKDRSAGWIGIGDLSTMMIASVLTYAERGVRAVLRQEKAHAGQIRYEWISSIGYEMCIRDRVECAVKSE